MHKNMERLSDLPLLCEAFVYPPSNMSQNNHNY